MTIKWKYQKPTLTTISVKLLIYGEELKCFLEREKDLAVFDKVYTKLERAVVYLHDLGYGIRRIRERVMVNDRLVSERKVREILRRNNVQQ